MPTSAMGERASKSKGGEASDNIQVMRKARFLRSACQRVFPVCHPRARESFLAPDPAYCLRFGGGSSVARR
jgi:hypothetical protein